MVSSTRMGGVRVGVAASTSVMLGARERWGEADPRLAASSRDVSCDAVGVAPPEPVLMVSCDAGGVVPPPDPVLI